MKSIARIYCWWPSIDKDLEMLVKNCVQCNRNLTNPAKTRKHIWEAPDTPFERVHVDFAGPFLGHMFFIYIDAYSKWPEIHIMKNINTSTTIMKCKEIFSVFGIPQILVSDNGTTFTSSEFQNFLEQNGIIHKTSAPFHPATIGQAERYVRILKDHLKKEEAGGGNIKEKLLNVLTRYRTTPHCTTGETPCSLLFKYNV